MKIACLLLIGVFACSCSGQNKKLETELAVEQAKTETATDEQTQAIIMFVNTSGLRVRDGAGLGGTVIDKLEYGTPVTVINKTGTLTEIEGITDYWYEIETGKTTGWVFGGYLSQSSEEYSKENFIGRYFYESVYLTKGDERDRKKYLSDVENASIDIAHKEGNIYLFSLDFPSVTHIGAWNKIEIRLPGNSEKLFLSLEAEKGGGGTYYRFYHHESTGIEFKFRYYSDLNGYLEEGEKPYPVDDVEFTVLFQKGNLQTETGE
jgi:hypothetical protein